MAAGRIVSGIFLPSEGRKRFEKPRSRIPLTFSEAKKGRAFMVAATFLGNQPD